MSNELADLAAEAAKLKEESEYLDLQLSIKKKELADCTQKILKALELADMDSFKAHGYTFFQEHKTSVSVPKTLEEKKALFDYLESKGLFMEMLSINSQTLNKLYKDLAEEALEQGILDFKMPGVAEPVLYTNLKLRRQ